MTVMIVEDDAMGPNTPPITQQDLVSAPYDQDFGRSQVPVRRPIQDLVFTARVKDRWSQYNATITPEDIVSALQAAEQGDLKSQNDLFERMEEQDMALSGFMATRRLAPSGVRYTVEPRSKSPEAVRAADLCREVLLNLSVRDMLMDMADAIGKGISMLEIDWIVSEDRVWPREVRHINPKRYVYDDKLEQLLITVNNEDEGIAAVTHILTCGGRCAERGCECSCHGHSGEGTKAIAPPPFKVIAHRSKMRSGHPGRAGALRVVVLGFLIRNFGYKDWSTYGEVFGMPLRVGKYPAGTGEVEKAALLEAVRMLGSDAAAIISQQTELEIKDAVNRGVEPYSALIAGMRTEMALAILGQEMTNNAPGASGARAAAQVQQMVRQDLLEADCEQIMATIARDLFRPIVGFNLGWELARTVCPIFKLHYEPPADHKTLIEIDRILFAPKSKGGLALPITKQQLYQRYNVEPPPPDAQQDDYLVQPEDEMPQGAEAEDPRRLRQRNQDGENHDPRDNRDRRVERTRAGSGAAVMKALLEKLDSDEKNDLLELLTAGD